MSRRNPSNSKKSTNVRTDGMTAALRLVLRGGGRLLPEATARLAGRIFLRPPRRRSRADERAQLARGRRFHLPVHGYGEIPVWSWGDGPAVLLVHGWGGSAAQMTPLVDPLLREGFSVLAFDAPGHGEAAGRSSSLLAIARILRSVTHRVGGVHGVVAHSGGAAATRYALATGARADRAVFVGAPAEWEPFLRQFGAQLGLSDEVLKRMRAHLERRLGVPMDEIRADLVVEGKLSRLLVLHDRHDREVPSTDGENVAEAWPQAELALTDGLGHRRILADPAVHRRITELLGDAICGHEQSSEPQEIALAAG